MGKNGYLPLFEIRSVKTGLPYSLYAASVLVSVCFVFGHRVSSVPAPGEAGRLAWIGLFLAEVWFGFYWLVTQTVRWNLSRRYTFKDRLSQRYEDDLPGIDIFVCTADPIIEPPVMVINTVLSMMAYDYPPHKMSVYLSDDGGSNLMFYALLEASNFSKHWLPFCKKWKIEPRSPSAYFSNASEPTSDDPMMDQERSLIEKLYEKTKTRIEGISKLGRIPEEVYKQHKGFREWDLVSSKRDHHPIVLILIDGRDSKAVDIEGKPLPTLVYMAREKRPHYHHNFKAGAMNALIRVSSRISNNPITLNVDCDMYSNNSQSIRDAVCFFMDEKKGHDIGYIQYPQYFNNITKNDIYSNSLRVIFKLEYLGIDSNGGPLYIGTGCFHMRDILCGKKYDKEYKTDWKTWNCRVVTESVVELEEMCKDLATCAYEENTQWGKEMGLIYGCPVEDVITGLSIQCRGWKSVHFDPERKGFLGVAPTTLLQTLVQHKRWAEGDFQIFCSKYCPFILGHGKIPLKLQFSYCCCLLWAPNCLPTLYYCLVPALCLLEGISVFPKFSSPWILPYVYVIIAKYSYSFAEFLWCEGTVKGWWNDQRIWLYRRLTSYLFAICETILKTSGLSKSGFVITEKVSDEDVTVRYEQEIMEFGVSSLMFTILATMALIDMFCIFGGIKKVIGDSGNLDTLALQLILCGLVLIINVPLYQGLFFRKDQGRMPSSVTYQSLGLAIFACLLVLY